MMTAVVTWRRTNGSGSAQDLSNPRAGAIENAAPSWTHPREWLKAATTTEKGSSDARQRKKESPAALGMALLLAVLPCTESAWAGGIWLYEMATPDLGHGGGGRAALGLDASTAWANPAGMTRLDQSSSWRASGLS